jgi:hypothetical protein
MMSQPDLTEESQSSNNHDLDHRDKAYIIIGCIGVPASPINFNDMEKRKEPRANELHV